MVLPTGAAGLWRFPRYRVGDQPTRLPGDAVISKEGDLIIFECDRCSDFFETSTYDFHEALSRFREASWHSVQIGNSWNHHCPSCHEEYLLERKNQLSNLARKLNGES